MPFENSKAVLETLKNTVFFKDLGENDLHAVADLMEPVTFKKNDTVMKEGDNDASCYIVLQGAVQVYKSTPEKEQVLLMKLGQGDFVGLGALVDHAPHNATVKAAVEPTILLRLSSVAFETLLEKSPVVAKALLKYFAKELRSFRSRLVDVRGRSSEEGSNLIVFFDSKPYEKPYLEKHLKKQSDLDLEVKYFEVKLNKDTVQLAAGAKAVCIFVNDKCDADVLAQLSDIGVELVLLRCAGFNNVDIKAASALGISVARVPKYSPYAVAEHAVALIQSLNRKTTLAYTRVKSGNFALNGLVGFDLHGKTVGVIGTGKIGQIFIDIMLGFGCKVLCYDKFINKDVEKLPNVKYTDLNTVFRSCTIFSIHCPLTDETKHMINKETIELMPKGAMLINTSRGALVDSAALVHGLKSKHLGAAGLDVYEEEAEYFFEDKSASVITDDILARLLSFPNVLITAHQAFLTEEALEAIAQVTTQNLQELLVGKKKMKEMTNTVLE